MSVPPSLSPTPGVPAVLRTSVSHPPTGPQTASATQQAPGPCLEAWAPVPGLQGLRRLTPRGPVRPPCSAGKPGWSGALCRVWFHGNRRGDTAQAAGSLAGGEQGKTFVRPRPSSLLAALRRLPLTPSAAHGVTQAYSSPPAAGRLVPSGTPWCCHWRHGRCLASPHFPPGHVAVTSRVPGPPGHSPRTPSSLASGRRARTSVAVAGRVLPSRVSLGGVSTLISSSAQATGPSRRWTSVPSGRRRCVCRLPTPVLEPCGAAPALACEPRARPHKGDGPLTLHGDLGVT